jgi:hypothetical protein
MESKKINQLATEMSPAASDLTIIGDPITGVSKKITLEQISSLFSSSISFYSNYAAFPATGSIDTLYCAKDTNKLYLWSGSAYVQTFPSQALLDTYQLRSEKSAANGYASLDGSGKVPSAELPSYVDDIIEVANYASLPVTGETGKIYITLDNNKIYRWSGSVYVEIASNNAIWGSITGTLSNQTDLQNALNAKVPYTGATANVNLGTFDLTADVITGATGSFASSGGSDTFAINHSSGSGIALNITKGGNGEGIYINKTSGSGNAATIIGTLNATTLVKSGGTSSQFLKADGSVDSSTYLTTSAAASTYLPLTGGTLSGLLNISTASYLTSRLKLTNTATGGNIWSVSSGNANNSTNNGLFSIINETLGKNIFSLSPTGNIIIGEDVGTANPAYNLQVIGTNTVIKATDLTGNNSNATLQATNSAAYLSAGYATTAIPLIFQTGGATRLTIAATGEATLTGALNGTSIALTGTAGDSLLINHSVTRGIRIASSGSGYGIIINNATGATSIPFTIQQNGAASITLNANGSADFAGALNGTSASFSGSVGVGVTSSGDRLNVLGTDYNNTAYFLGGSTTGASYGLQIKAGTNSSDYSLLVQNQSGSSTYLKVSGSGNVGIGTSTPGQKLSIAGRLNFDTYSTDVDDFGMWATSSGTTIASYSTSNIMFRTANAERMRITSGGNVGIGTSSPSQRLTLVGSSTLGTFAAGTDTTHQLLIGADTSYAEIQAITQGVGFNKNLILQRQGGNVGIGTSPQWGLSGYTAIEFGNYGLLYASTSSGTSTTLANNLYHNGSNWIYKNTQAGSLIGQGSGTITFETASSGTAGTTASITERMRITSGGSVAIGTSSAIGSYKLTVANSALGGVCSTADGVGDAAFLSLSTTIGFHFYGLSGSAKFYVVNGGQIYSTSTSISAISDIRHKENIRPIETGLNEILALKPSRFDWKEGKGTEKKDVAGFIAQDIEEIFPDLVDEWKETMDATETFKSIRMTDLIPTLVKAIQELKAEIDELKIK